MNVDAALLAALAAAGLSQRIVSRTDLSGGCSHRVLRIGLADRTEIVAKVNRVDALRMFKEEARGLRELAATQSVVVPVPLAAAAASGAAVLLMTLIPQVSASRNAWEQFGRDLAALHAAPVGDRYGWEMDNHLGSSLQPNAWHEDWVAFNAGNRLGFQLAMARDSRLLDESEANAVERVILRLDRLIPHRPKPSLLHGDLWSGNVLPARIVRNGADIETCAAIDPACSIGHGLADVAMMQLFGGFPADCFRAYEDVSGERLRDESSEKAIGVYQMYHVLNHVNLFGRGYIDQALILASRLGE